MGQSCSSMFDGPEPAHLSLNQMTEENQKKKEQEVKRQKDEQERRQRELEEERKRKNAADAESKHRADVLAADEKRKAEEARRLQDQRARDAKLAEQRARHEEEARRETEQKKQRVNDYLKAQGFTQINETKKYKRNILNHMHTPLHAAVQENSLDMVKLLLEFGADRNIQADRKTPKQLAIKLNKKDSHSAIVALLDKAM